MLTQFPPLLRAIILMIAGMFFFMMGDLFLKLASQHLPLGLVVFLLGFGMAGLFACLMARQGDVFFDKLYWHHAMVMRCLGESIGVIGVIIAVAFAPLSTVTAIMQSLPLLLTLFGAIFLKERVGIHRIIALGAGLIGVLIIIRPGMAGFDFYASFTLIGVLGMAIRDIGTRIMPETISTSVLSFWGSVAIALTGIGMVLVSQEAASLAMPGFYFSAGLVIAAAIGTYCVSTAMRLAEVSAISPFRYVRVVFGIGTGIVLLGESVDAPTYLGCVIVVAAGLYSWFRERKKLYQQTEP